MSDSTVRYWALIVGGKVQQITTQDPTGNFHPDLEWVSASSTTAINDVYATGSFSGPAVPALTIDGQRAALATYRYGKETGGVMFQAAGASAAALLATGRDDQAKLNAAFVMATSGHWADGTPWKMTDGSFMPMTAADIQAAAVKAATYVALCYAHEAVLSAEMASNLSMDITTGWPANT